MIFAKSKKLLREVKWFGRRMSLHSRYWISLSGRPSAYLPGFTAGSRVTLLSFFSVFFFVAARFGIVFLNVVSRGRRPFGAAPSKAVGESYQSSGPGDHPIVDAVPRRSEVHRVDSLDGTGLEKER